MRRVSTRLSPRLSARFSARLLLTAAASVTALAAVPAAAHADTGPFRMPPPPFGSPDSAYGDHLLVSVAGSGNGSDGTHELECGPAGGTHADPGAACGRLDELAAGDPDPFAPVPKGAYCTMQYGGGATAHITGTWHGRPVDASYKLTNGCEISRWQRMVPVLPATAP
ncbi:SSI family serine proteinase inhibitor [Streptomyces sp. NPDC102467]|uniref:SSI family serine proteinase inhibitor n=1 Tax=Streptomyces sp. NPDC102467 TaxID=3366179 RepID=UPI00381E0631